MTHPGWHHVEEHAQGFPKMCDLWGWWWFKPKLEALEVESNFKKENQCHKKKTQPQFFFKTLFLLRELFKSNLETSLRRNKDLIKNCARVFFLWHPFSEFFFLKFDSTLTANNSGSKPLNLKKYHIFGILRTSAFTWSYPGWVIPVQNFE